MVRGIKGYRGRLPAEVAAIGEILLRVARPVRKIPQIVELDLNSVIALPPGTGTPGPRRAHSRGKTVDFSLGVCQIRASDQ